MTCLKLLKKFYKEKTKENKVAIKNNETTVLVLEENFYNNQKMNNCLEKL